uniref:Uncharacterized protein n=1 Tax=Hanusia phi TaxID=3032 RepID=A0A7S0E5C9_9CRYP
MSQQFFKTRGRMEETHFAREKDKFAYKSIRDALKESGQLDAARKRLEEALKREANGVDILAEVSAARAMAKFNEEDLPPVTIHPRMTAENQGPSVLKEIENFMKNVKLPKPRDHGEFEVAQDGLHAITRGRYAYLNDFMKSMEVQPEERRPMTKREMFRAQKFYESANRNAKAIGGAFFAGSALCLVGGAAAWYATKRYYNVKDSKEYAQKMRELTPETTKHLQEGSFGTMIRGTNETIRSWVSKN